MLKRGAIWLAEVESVGNEILGQRPCIIISSDAFNQTGVQIVCSITGGGLAARTKGFAVSLTGLGLKTDGVVRCEQVRSLDLKARNAKYLEIAPAVLVDQVVRVLSVIIE